MTPRNITKSLPKDEVQRLIKRWHHIRQGGWPKETAEKRIGYKSEKMTRWASSHNLDFTA